MSAGQVAIYMLMENGRIPLYVGRTTNPERRLGQHLGPRCHSAVLAWVIEKSREWTGRNPDMHVVEVCDTAIAPARERAWIDRVLANGWSPANSGPGRRDNEREMWIEANCVHCTVQEDHTEHKFLQLVDAGRR